MGPDDEGVDSVAKAIETYLKAHPNAADSVEGIANWWLQRQRYRTAVTQVEQALRQLEERGVVRRSTNASGRVVYRAVEQNAEDDTPRGSNHGE